MLSVLPFTCTYCTNVIRFTIYMCILYKCYPFYHLHVHTVYMLSVLPFICTYRINVIRFTIYMYILYKCYPFYHLHVHTVYMLSVLTFTCTYYNIVSVLPFTCTYCINVIHFNIYMYILYTCYPF